MLYEKSRTKSVGCTQAETGPVFAKRSAQNPSGFVVLLMLLIIVVVGCLVWLDPFAFSGSSDPDMPWNKESLLLRHGQSLEQFPSDEQPQLTKTLWYQSDVKKEGDSRGNMMMEISTDGTIKGSWSGEYNQSREVNYLVADARFKGNVNPEEIYTDQQGQDPTKLYFITKGKFIMMETRKDTGTVRKVSGNIYVTGWIDPDYSATGKIIITSNKKSYQSFSWQANPHGY